MKKLIIYCLSFVLLSTLIVFNGCNKEEEKEPGPISVENNLSPSTLNHGDYINWTIKVTNSGGKEVEIDKIHCKEEFISGEFAGQYIELDLPSSNSTIDGKATETVYNKSSSVVNTTTIDAIVKNTVTVYSDGGDDTDETIYTIKASKKKGEISCEVQSCNLKIIRE